MNPPGDDEQKAERRIPVYSGDPIVLRNDWTGGLLSLGNECQLPPEVDSNGSSNAVAGVVGIGSSAVDRGTIPGWNLRILTSSYQLNPDSAASTEDDRPLIEYLHEHNKCRPRKSETFQIIMADVPVCPQWCYSTGERSGAGDRIYLHGNYLNHPERHARLESEMELEMFPEMEDYDEESRKGGGNNEWPKLAELAVDVQERVLMDEIIGAMMGQEGHFIRYQLPEEEDESDEEDEYIASEKAFRIASASVLGGAIDSSLENILLRILPLCTNYAVVNQYVSACLNHYECGVIARTLCEAINSLLEEYLAFVANLDYLSREPAREGGGRLAMSMVHVHAQPSIRTMAILSSLSTTLSAHASNFLD